MTRAILALALACGTVEAQSLDLSSTDLIAEGAVQFAKSCAVGYCHGSEGRSARGPALRDRVWDPRDLYRITADGMPGTAMPAWRDVLRSSTIWAVTAYILSLSTEPPSGEAAIVEADPTAGTQQEQTLSEAASHGKELFFDLARQRRCGVCHELDGLGSAVGPNLAISARSKTASQLLRDIREPDQEIAYGFEQVQLLLRSGERIQGILAEETETRIKLFVAGSIPPPLRSVAKSDIQQQGTRRRSSMPADLERSYSDEEMEAIVAYLKESGG